MLYLKKNIGLYMKTKGKSVPEDKIIGGNLLKIRKARELSQEALAESIGVTFQQVQKYEKGSNRISASTLLMISNKLDVPILDLYDGLIGDQASFLEGISSQSLKLAVMLDKIEDKEVLKVVKQFLKNVAQK